MRDAVLGRDLPRAVSLIVLFLLILQIALNFARFDGRPVGLNNPTAAGVAARDFFPARLRHQNIDTPGWVLTGLMLPTNAPRERAMRPLYPLPVTLARVLGVVPADPGLKALPAGAQAYGSVGASLFPAIHVLQFTNACLALLSGWLFFAFCRRFGFSPPAATCAALVAGSGFGFSFWVVQATPELFGYTTVIVTLVLAMIAHETDVPRELTGVSRLLRQGCIWGCVGSVVGIMLLGKESFNLPIFVGLLLLLSRRWVGVLTFSAATLLPTLLWNYYMARIVKAYDPAEYLRQYKFVVWLWQDLGNLPWSERLAAIGKNFTTQVVCLGRAYAYVPLIVAAIGIALGRNTIPRRGILLACFFMSLYLLFLASNFIMPRLMFLSWPAVYFFAWVAVERLAVFAERAGRPGAPVNPTGPRRWAIRLTALAGFMALGTRDHFDWYFYG